MALTALAPTEKSENLIYLMLPLALCLALSVLLFPNPSHWTLITGIGAPILILILYETSPDEKFFKAMYRAKMREMGNELQDSFILLHLFIKSWQPNLNNPFTKKTMFAAIKVILKDLGTAELLTGIKVKAPISALKRSDLLASQQVSALLRNCKTTTQRALLELLIESGCRIGEALKLTKQDIELKQHFALVTFDGKTGSRQVPLMQENLTSFLYHYATTSEDRLFPFVYSTIRWQFVYVCRRAEVKYKKIFHNFRHMKATHLLELGVPESIIRRFMGWSKTSPMIARYGHMTSRNVQDFFSRLYGYQTEPVEPLYPEEEKRRLKHLLG